MDTCEGGTVVATIADEVMTHIEKEIDASWEDEVAFLKDLVRYPSISGEEKPAQKMIANYLEKELDMKVDRFQPNIDKIKNHPGFSPVEWDYENSDIVIGQHFGEEQEKNSLILQGHTDVVSPEPVGLWSSPPYEPVVTDGKLYGRGAADMKGGLAAMIFAYRAIVRAGFEPKSNVMLQFVPDEERTGNGALAALHEGYTAKGALIPEPFGMKAAVAQVGSLWFRVKFRTVKKTKHGNVQANAIEKSQQVIAALKNFEKQLSESVTHPAFADQDNPLDMNLGVLEVGDFESNEPVTGKIEGRIALLPNETVNERKDQLREYIQQTFAKDDWFNDQPPEVEFYGFHAEATVSDDQTPLFKVLDASHEAVTGTYPERRSLPSTTDARFFHLYYDMDAICYGPDGGNFHEIDEWVDLESVKKVTKVYAHMLASWSGLKRIK
ncbi:acetylornithine deacetylase [Geomicrobium sp. JCM 19039]|nr:acetylornithine deacetylase [Geomicrobium sp. JCM 19039]